jgi:hypothetical protein
MVASPATKKRELFGFYHPRLLATKQTPQKLRPLAFLRSKSGPLCARERTVWRSLLWSALGHERTHAAQQLGTYAITSSARASTSGRHFEAKRLCREIGRFLSLENAIYIPCSEPSALRDGHAVDLDIERTGPLRDAEEDSGRRVLGEVAFVDLIEGLEALGGYAEHVALQHVI